MGVLSHRGYRNGNTENTELLKLGIGEDEQLYVLFILVHCLLFKKYCVLCFNSVTSVVKCIRFRIGFGDFYTTENSIYHER
jgi:hypothetical protein